mmetsp:Transcript_5539/g.11478  ORF Transcript_5539/g.11478 Transcript_5539/m.11478 type:complete len:432 (+) Transcript_5539:93-1388(+)
MTVKPVDSTISVDASAPHRQTPPASAPKQPFSCATSGKGKKDDDDDDIGDDIDDNIDINDLNDAPSSGGNHLSFRMLSGGSQQRRVSWSFLRSVDPGASKPSIYCVLPSFGKLCLQSLGIATITLYVLNQKHMLPKPMGIWVSKLLFWPTLPITLSRRIGKWTTVVDETVVIGGAPFGFMGYPERLAEKFGVKGVVNMCDEYHGPVSSYRKLGIEHLRLPTVDHFEPSVDDLKRAVSFIQKHESQGSKVYVHCRAGHGRSAAAVFAWLLYKEPLADPMDLNEKLCAMRDVRKNLWKQPNINTFRVWLQNGGMMDESDSDVDDEALQRLSRSSNNIIRPETSSSLHHRRPRNKRYKPWDEFSETDFSLEDDSDGTSIVGGTNLDVSSSSLGQVFSDEDITSTDSYSDNEEFYDDYSDDEKDYAMWKSYNRKD